MRLRLLKAGVAALAVAGSIAAPATAAATATSATFPGGSLTGLAADATFTQGSFQNLSYRYEGCGTEPAEATCTWELRVTLYSDPARRCVPSTPEVQLLWDSGKESGNGSVDLGPFGFALEGCKGQTLGADYEAEKTFNPEEEEGPWKKLASGGSAPLFSVEVGAESAEEAEQQTEDPSTQPVAPTPLPTLAVSATCRSLRIGSTRYAFVFRRMGCHTATHLATIAHLSHAPPSGYRCMEKPRGGMRCWRRGRPKKYLEWHIPHRGPTRRAP